MQQVFLSLGSNENCEHHLHRALTQLSEYFGELNCSSVYRSPPINGAGNDYCNMAVAFDSKKPIAKLVAICKTIEAALERKRPAADDKAAAIISIDIDLLLVGDTVGKYKVETNKALVLPHSDIESYSHVLIPLTELAPHYIHPRLGVNFKQLLSEKKFKPLEKIHFTT